jgi:hypothetical protein
MKQFDTNLEQHCYRHGYTMGSTKNSGFSECNRLTTTNTFNKTMPKIVWPQQYKTNKNKQVLDYSLQILDTTCDKGPMRLNNISDSDKNNNPFNVVVSSILRGCACIVLSYMVFTKYQQRQLTNINTTAITTSNVRERLV